MGVLKPAASRCELDATMCLITSLTASSRELNFTTKFLDFMGHSYPKGHQACHFTKLQGGVNFAWMDFVSAALQQHVQGKIKMNALNFGMLGAIWNSVECWEHLGRLRAIFGPKLPTKIN